MSPSAQVVQVDQSIDKTLPWVNASAAANISEPDATRVTVLNAKFWADILVTGLAVFEWALMQITCYPLTSLCRQWNHNNLSLHDREVISVSYS